MKEPIEFFPGDVLVHSFGDVTHESTWLRGEDGKWHSDLVIYSDDMARKWIAGNHAKLIHRAPRPKPDVVLPEMYALGWIASSSGESLLGAWRADHDVDESNQSAAHGAVGWDLWDKDTYFKVTAFTPATAVPTDALDELMRRRDAGQFNAILGTAVLDFLAAVDAANGAAS